MGDLDGSVRDVGIDMGASKSSCLSDVCGGGSGLAGDAEMRLGLRAVVESKDGDDVAY